MAQLRYIFWDHDGVLVDTEEWYYQATRNALAEIGVNISRADYHQFRACGATAWDVARQAGVAEPVIAQHRAHRDRYYQEFLLREDIEIPGVEEVLALLKDRYKMAIVTTSRRTDFELIHRSRSIVKHMEFVLTVEDYEKEKPSPEPYLSSLKRFDCAPGEAIVVEDSEQGLKAAQAAGIECIIIRNRFFADAHDFAGACRVIASIRELPKVLSNWHLAASGT
jgi:HAD superfamily hydrolase (TIGR01509 family)